MAMWTKKPGDLEREDYLEIFREWRKLERERETESEEKGQP